MACVRVRIQTEDFDLSAEVRALQKEDANVGAVAAFVGTVRDASGGPKLSRLELEHYPGMTERAIEGMVEQALVRFNVRDALVVHRVGALRPRDQIVLVAVTAAHRAPAFQACEFLMDYLKTQAPFWKKEVSPEGARWVDARITDDQAMQRWGLVSTNAAR